MSVVVRRAIKADAQIIADFAQKLVLQHREYDAKRFTKLAGSKQAEFFYGRQTEVENSAVFVAELDEKIIGFAFIQFEEKNYADLLENAVWLHDLYVDEAYRGSSAGKLLLKAAIQAAKEFKASKLMLTVAAQNEKARQIFERAGFRTTMYEMMLDLTEQNND
jgi:GNAT superfamily N-acetyltransferase